MAEVQKGLEKVYGEVERQIGWNELEEEAKRARIGGIRDGIKEKILKSLDIYNLSLQQLVEGQREVLTNRDFKFEDGTSVEDRVEVFRRRVTAMLEKTSASFKKTRIFGAMKDDAGSKSENQNQESDNTAV